MPLRVSVMGAVVGLLGSLIVAAPANAAVSYTGNLRNWTHDNCLDSDNGGNAYALPCNGGNYQNWQIQFYASIDGFDTYRVVNQQTHRCLDGNDNSVYTNPCQDPNYWQKWRVLSSYNGSTQYFAFQSVQTGRCVVGFGTSLSPQQCHNYVSSESWRPGS